MGRQVFLLSPADASGKRARLLQSSQSESALARKLGEEEGAELGEVFSFVSSLYFRGKLAYARAFGRAPAKLHASYVITPGDGLRPPETLIRLGDLRRYARVPVDPENSGYREPFMRDLSELARRASDCEFVLLGSIASPKYTDLLTSVLDTRILFPEDFIGRGDMSRGGLMLRCARAGEELRYIQLLGANRRGKRPPKLPPLQFSRPERNRPP